MGILGGKVVIGVTIIYRDTKTPEVLLSFIYAYFLQYSQIVKCHTNT